MADQLSLSYIVPLRCEEPDADLALHLEEIVAAVDDLIVVDGSDPPVFERHAELLPPKVRHLRPEHVTSMGKVGGVLTGLQHARHDLVVVADDDVRWSRCLLERAVERLGDAQVGRPQNVFDPDPWYARWDTGRMLLNRATSGDWPGTLLVRRSALPSGYAGDVLFENLEMVRTVRAAGGSEVVLLDVVVPRRPPTVDRFWEQRVRHAYDEWARPWRLLFQLTWLPLTLFRPRRAVVLAAGAVAVAELGRRRAGGSEHWRPTAPLWAVPWLAERAITSWLAVLARCRGGVPYRERRLSVAAHSTYRLRRGATATVGGP